MRALAHSRLYDLYKDFYIYWADDDATTHQIPAMTGYISRSEIERFTRGADLERMAQSLAGGHACVTCIKHYN